MTGVVRAFASGAIGVFAAEALSPHVDKIFKPDSAFAAKAVKAGVSGVGTAVAYYALGALGIAK